MTQGFNQRGSHGPVALVCILAVFAAGTVVTVDSAGLHSYFITEFLFFFSILSQNMRSISTSTHEVCGSSFGLGPQHAAPTSTGYHFAIVERRPEAELREH